LETKRKRATRMSSKALFNQNLRTAIQRRAPPASTPIPASSTPIPASSASSYHHPHYQSTHSTTNPIVACPTSTSLNAINNSNNSLPSEVLSSSTTSTANSRAFFSSLTSSANPTNESYNAFPLRFLSGSMGYHRMAISNHHSSFRLLSTSHFTSSSSSSSTLKPPKYFPFSPLSSSSHSTPLMTILPPPTRFASSSSSSSPLAHSRSISTTSSSAIQAAAVAVNPNDSDDNLALTPVKHIRNIAIIAHVDHGKTTLVDKLLRECNEVINKERVMDSNDLEFERGITIFSKCTSVEYTGIVINIVDTPGHADFGGEVERVLDMVDSVVLLVDATEGPMTQTKFVLNKALRRGLKPVVVLNKVDRDTCRIDHVESEIFDLFANLNATEDQLEFTTLYASSREGWAVKDLKKDPKTNGMKPLLDHIVNNVPPPMITTNLPFSMLVTMLGYDKFVGRLLTGRVRSGVVKIGDPIHAISVKGEQVELGKVTKITKRKGITDVELKEAKAGDIITIAGLSKATVTDTITDLGVTTGIETTAIDPPTVTMTFSVNDSPFNSRFGSKLTSQQIGDRLKYELEHNVSINVMTSPERSEEFEVQGRGEMQLGVLIENMRREGFELSVSPPKVVIKEEKGQKFEPLEELIIEIENTYTGIVMEKLNSRKGELIDMKPTENNRVRLYFQIPSRGLLGYRSEFMVDTHGSGVMNRAFHSYIPYKGPLEKVRKGVLVASETGKATAYSLANLEPRGQLFIKPGAEVYVGMIIGEHNRNGDLDINPVKSKKLTNIRTHAHDENIKLAPIRQFSLEEALSYVAADEMVEVTPNSLNLRKKILDPAARKRLEKKSGN